ncbi:WD40/YVTN/BNR-like repeat-containing protein [Roseateles cellulosilyticus]|uniref:Exo-alpha-sialidase n=1 Tax=Pelomonas cellulosilytica TaxID=2906762 RepID=A0ABS8XN01_9BURK|nr:sialidase family protein [Pelomonas sp. P8]MCE4553208.1 exo-alpha-sialidase [Pelomonas sp. P8]
MSNDRAWAATRKGLFELRRRNGSWQIEQLSFIADPVSMLLPPDASGRMLAALNLGHFGAKVHASDDAGQTWHEVAAPTFPPQPDGAEGPPWKLDHVFSLERVGDAIWCGTVPGGLFVSQDRGETWTLNEPLWADPRRTQWMGGGNPAPAMHSICPHPQRADELLVGVSCGGAWRTTDGGSSWALSAKGMMADYMPPELAGDENSQDPHLIARCRSEPDVLWCQHHCGIFRSADNGATWAQLQARPSSFGFAVAAHPHDPLTAWFAPAVKDMQRLPVDAALCVTRTRDGGQTFEALRDGLPQQHCYDLVFRHGLAVDDAGEQLMMGSTTGGLWSSSDAGDSWQMLPARLPPVYAVKFG